MRAENNDRNTHPHDRRAEQPAHHSALPLDGDAGHLRHPVLGVHDRTRRDLPLPPHLDGCVVAQPCGGTSQTDGWGFGNYIALGDYQAGIWVYLGNSLFVSVLTVALTLFISLLGGYAFARFSFPGKNALFLLTLAILMVPYATLLIPLYVILNAVGLQNSLVGVALVITMFQLPFSMFMMRISFESIPKEMDEAAMVDGCSSWKPSGACCCPRSSPAS